MPQAPGPTKWEQMTSSTCERCDGFCSHNFGRKILWTVIGIFLVYGVFYLGTLIRNNLQEYNFIGRAPRMERTISINGFGKVTGNNDIAQTTIGFSNTDKDIAKAQADNKKVMDQVYADLKKLGVAEKDLQGNYNIYPEYNYTQDKGQELKGYRVTNSLTIKIRDLNKISEILSLAGKYGANEVAGLSFTIDDPENLKMEAKQKALADAKMKAENLARTLNVKLGGVVSYYESEVGDGYYAPKYDMAMGMGGVMMNAAAPTAVPSGSADVSMNVTIIYEILP